MASIKKRTRTARRKDARTGQVREVEVEYWRARYRDDGGKEHVRHFDRRVDAQKWLDEVTASLVAGTHVAPKTARMTVGEWCDTWLEGYATRRRSTVRQARVHVARIKAEFGGMRLSAVRPSHVKAWTARLRMEGKQGSDGTPWAAGSVLRLCLPCPASADHVRRGARWDHPEVAMLAPYLTRQGKQRPYVATTEQLWALYDVMPERLGAAVLLGALAGLRLAESCGLRVSDVDFMRGIVFPRMQYPAEELKTEISRTPIPVGQSLALQLSAYVKKWSAETLLTGADGGQLSPWALERAVRTARKKVEGLPAGFRYHDLRHYFASLLIAHGADVKTVQARLRHGSAKTTLDTYGHLWPDKDESTKAVIDAVVDSKFRDLADSVRTERGAP